MKWNKKLDILLICEYNVEKTMFLEKIGSGDYYRQLLDVLIKEVKEDRLGRKYFHLIDKEAIKEQSENLTIKRKEKLHKDCIEYYQHKTKNYDKTYQLFEHYATRYLNLIGHYFALELYEDAAKVLDEIGLYLYKWGFVGFLSNILKKFPEKDKPCVVNKLNTLFLLESLQIEDEDMNKIRKTFDLCGLSIMNERGSESKILNEMINSGLNAEDELIQLMSYLYLKNIKLLQGLVINNRDIELFTKKSEFYFIMLCDDVEYKSKYQYNMMDDPYFEKLYFCMRFHESFEKGNEVEQITKWFTRAHQSIRALKFDVTMLYVDLVVGFLEMKPSEKSIDNIQRICNLILENKQMKSYIHGIRFLKNINAYHNGNGIIIESPTGKTKLDMIFEAYVRMCEKQ